VLAELSNVPFSVGSCAIAAVLDYTMQYILTWGKLKFIDNQNIALTEFSRINQDIDFWSIGISCGMAFLGLDSKVANVIVATGDGIRVAITQRVAAYNQAHPTAKITIEDYGKIVEIVKNDFTGVIFEASLQALVSFIAISAGEKWGPAVSRKIANGVRSVLIKTDDFGVKAIKETAQRYGKDITAQAQLTAKRIKTIFCPNALSVVVDLAKTWTTRRLTITFTNNQFTKKITEGANNVILKWVQNGGKIRFAGGATIPDMKNNLRTQLASALGTYKHIPPLQAHHVIPLELWDNDVVQHAALDGFHINDIINGIGLETPSLHNGSHPNYTNYVKRQITDWVARNPGYNSRQANDFLQQELIKNVKKQIYEAQKRTKGLEEYFTSLF
jgi:hypothetical protein